MIHKLREHSRLLASASSSIILLIGSLLFFQYAKQRGLSELIYLYVNAQLIASLISIFIFYASQFEIHEKKVIKIYPLIIFGLLISFIFPLLSLTILFLTKIGLQKFGRLEGKVGFLQVLTLLIVSFFAVFINQGSQLMAIVLLISLMPMLTLGETGLELPDFSIINKMRIHNILFRSALDLSLLIPPLIINLYTKAYFDSLDYMNLQQLIYCLAGLSAITTIVEKIIFDNTLMMKYQDDILVHFCALLFFTYLGVFGLAIFFAIPLKYFWYLLAAPPISILFTYLLSLRRKEMCERECFRISIKWVLLSLAFSFVLMAIRSFDVDLVLTTIMAMLVLSFLQLITLIYHSGN